MSPNSGITVGGRTLDPLRGGVVILVIGLVVAGFGVYDYVQQSDATENAVEVDATITETGVDTVTQRRGGPDYKPEVDFEYSYRGESYTGDQIYPATITSNYDTRSAAESVLQEYEVGETVTAFVDPDSPGDAFLEDERSNDPLLFAGIGLLFVLVGGRSVVRALRGT